MTLMADQPAASTDPAARAVRIMESMAGAAVWETDAAGRFTYVTPGALVFVGSELEDLNGDTDPGAFGWRSLMHPQDYDRVAALWRHCVRTGDRYDIEHRMRRGDGIYIWCRTVGRPIREADGAVAGWRGTTFDIDDQKRVEAALREREQELSQLVDMVPSHLWRLAPDGEPIFFNRRMVDYLGLDADDLDRPGMTRLEAMLATVHGDDVDTFRTALLHCLATGEPLLQRYRLRRVDGAYHWMSSRAEPMRDQDGHIVQWYGLCHDIDEQVKAEEALRGREREISQLVDLVPVHIRRLTPEGEPTFFNKRLLDFFGLDPALLDEPGTSRLAKTIGTLVHPDDADRLLEAVRHSLATGDSYSIKYRMRRADGAYRWVDGRAEPVRDECGAIIHWYAISIDIDDEVRAQEALRQSEQQLQRIVDAVPVHIWSWTPSGQLAYVSKRYLDHLGLSEANFGDFVRVAQELVHPDDAPEVQRIAANCLATGEPFVMRYRRRSRDGTYRWMEGRCEPLRDENGTIVHWYGVSLDIDDGMRAHEAVRESERSLRQLVETLPAMIDCAAPDGEPVYRSQQLREFLGYQLEALDGAGKTRLAGTLEAGIHPDDLVVVQQMYARSLSSGEPYARRHRLRRFDGEYRWVETRAAPMRNAEGTIVQWNVICLDIESEVRAQDELRLERERLARAAQAASLAELSASIAHEVNQPLAAIVANSHACHRWLSADPPNVERAKDTAEFIIHDANSAADVVSRIRALFRQTADLRTSTALEGIIVEARDLLADEAVQHKVRVELAVEDTLPNLALDRVQIQQVLINLMRNGVEAMVDVVGERILRIRARPAGDAIRTEISDRGPGIETPHRIFDPFYTTKQHGMGMGLAICRSIVEAHGGRLWAENSQQGGATFVFTLPLDANAAQ